MMRLKNIFIGFLLLGLAACSSGQPDVVSNSLTDLMLPKPGMARLVVYYPYSHFWTSEDVDLSLGGRSGCTLKSGTYSIYDITPGKLPISAGHCDGSEKTQLVLQKVEPGHSYYIQIVPNDTSMLGMIASAGIPTATNPKSDDYHISAVKPGDKLPPASVAQLNHAEGAAFLIDLMDEKRAIEQMRTLKMVAG